MSPPELSIVFPAYNEELALAQALRRTASYLDGRRLRAEVVVVDDGSVDGTLRIAREFAGADSRFRVVRHSPNRGKGHAVSRGMLAARGAYRAFLDVDLATPVEDTDKLLAPLREGADLAIGTRYHQSATIEVAQSRARRFMGWVFRKLAGALLSLQVSDITCGFKGMRGDVAEALFRVQRETGWAFDAELIHLARTWQLDVREVPVRWRDSGDSRVRPLANAWESLGELVRIRRNDRRGMYARPQPGNSA